MLIGQQVRCLGLAGSPDTKLAKLMCKILHTNFDSGIWPASKGRRATTKATGVTFTALNPMSHAVGEIHVILLASVCSLTFARWPFFCFDRFKTPTIA